MTGWLLLVHMEFLLEVIKIFQNQMVAMVVHFNVELYGKSIIS